MCKLQISFFLCAMVASVVFGADALAQSRRQDTCESMPLTAQASQVVDPETTARAEERAESLRARLFDLAIKELDLLARLDDLEYRSSPEGIQRALAFVGSARPMDELRDALSLRLEREKARVNSQIELLASIRVKLENALREADSQAERSRQR